MGSQGATGDRVAGPLGPTRGPLPATTVPPDQGVAGTIIHEEPNVERRCAIARHHGLGPRQRPASEGDPDVRLERSGDPCDRLLDDMLDPARELDCLHPVQGLGDLDHELVAAVLTRLGANRSWSLWATSLRTRSPTAWP